MNVRRAGLTTDADYLGKGAATEMWDASLSAMVNALQTTPGRLVQPVQTASLEAWIKLYRPDENTGNTAISYYVKGAVIGWILDARIRELSNGSKSLDDVFRSAFQRYSNSTGYTLEQFLEVIDEVADRDLKQWMKSLLRSTSELEFQPALDWLGLRFRPVDSSGPGVVRKASLGIQTQDTSGRLLIRKIPRGTTAETLLSVDDEILAIDGFRVTSDSLPKRLEQYRAGDEISILVARREKIVPVKLKLDEEPPRRWQIETKPDATPEQRARLAAWLNG